MVDIDKYLFRIGYHGPQRPDLETLHLIHHAHTTRVPWENIDFQIGRQVSLDAPWLVEKIVDRHRGGPCFELNGALEALLLALGYQVWAVEAAADRDRLGESAWGNHLALIVELQGERWLADVGSSTAWTWPLLLREGPQRQGPFVYRLERLDGETWRVHRRPCCNPGVTDYRLTPIRIADYLDRHRVIGTTTEPPFSDLLIQLPLDDHVVKLRSLTLTRRGPGVPNGYVRRTISSRQEFTDLLVEQFDIGVADIGEDGLSELWTVANTQHENHLARAGR